MFGEFVYSTAGNIEQECYIRKRINEITELKLKLNTIVGNYYQES